LFNNEHDFIERSLEKKSLFSSFLWVFFEDLDKEKAKAYRLQLIGVLSELKSFKDSVIHCKKLLETGDIDINTKKTTYFLSAKVFSLLKSSVFYS